MTIFFNVAEAILRAEPTKFGSVDVDLEIGGATFQLRSENDRELCIQHGEVITKIPQIKFSNLKIAFLKEYICRKNMCAGLDDQVDLTSFSLNDLNLNGVNLRNCKLPDLVRSNLNGIGLDMFTSFKKRQWCRISETTYQQLQEHRKGQLKQSLLDVLPVADLVNMVAAYDNDNDVDIADLSALFQSADPDLGWLKRVYLGRDRAAMKILFMEMREKRFQIRLDHTDLSYMYLSAMDLSGASLIGADLHAAVLHDTNLNGADLRGTNVHSALFHQTKINNVIVEPQCSEFLDRLHYLGHFHSSSKRVIVQKLSDE